MSDTMSDATRDTMGDTMPTPHTTRSRMQSASGPVAPLMTPPAETLQPQSGFNVRDLALSLVVNGALPFLTYQFLRGRAVGELPALVISGVFPAIATGVSVARARRIDILGGIALLGIAVGVFAALVGGDVKLVLIRESFLTAALGLAALVSLAPPRPLMFLIGRQISAGNDPARLAQMERAITIPRWRRFFRILTLMWGTVWIGEFTLKVILVSSLSIAQVLVVGPILFNTVTFGMIGLTVWYVRRARSGIGATTAVREA